MKKVLGSAAFIFPVSMVLAVAAAAIFPVPAAAQNYQYLIPRGGENAKPYEPGVQLNPNGGSGPTALEQARRYQEQQRQEQERKEREAYNLKRQLGEAVYQSQKAFVTQRYDAADHSRLSVSRTLGLDARFHREDRIINGTSVMDCAQRCDAEGSACNRFPVLQWSVHAKHVGQPDRRVALRQWLQPFRKARDRAQLRNLAGLDPE